MAINEGGRMDAQFLVISLCPDVCKSPAVPVPYPIVGYMNQAMLQSPNVRARGKPVFHMGSRVTTVVGDEAGVGGGLLSQVFKGMCRPIIPTPTVRANGQFLTYHQNTLMFMNCAGPDGPFNTIGHVKFVGLMLNADVGPAGTIPADSNPPAVPETPAETGCLSKLSSMVGSASLGDIVGMGQTAYGLATTDWSNPSAVLGAIGGLAGMAGLGGVAQAANAAKGIAGLVTADWDNPGSALGAAMGIAGPMLSGMNGASSSNPCLPDVSAPTGSDGNPTFPPGLNPYEPCF